MEKQRGNWTKNCKTFVVVILTLISLFILILVAYEVFSEKKDVSISISLIAILGLIVSAFATILPLLLRHDRLKDKDLQEANNGKIPKNS